jgi:alanyl-tRNA synthetase
MNTKPELKIIADHLRSSCFLIADGALPSNEGRGYVLRRIMRRAMRQLHKLGARQATMHKLVDALIKEMGEAYPELARARDVIVETLKNEEEKFRETLEKGLKILEDSISHPPLERGSNSAEIQGGVKFSGEIAFKLYDTFGFPLDLTQDILKEKNLEVDLEEFNREMEKQRNRGKENWAGSGETKEDNLFFDLKEKFGETKFLGYESLSAKAKILAIIDPSPQPSPARGEGANRELDLILPTHEGEGSKKPKIIILNQTTFYATSGGQKGDDGKIICGENSAEISETKKFAGNLFVHFASNIKGEFRIGDEVFAEVNAKTRQARAANHSATHLMHKALKLVFGNSISQKGSNVDAESFTFDFNFNRAMTAQEIQKVEDLVNDWIGKKSAVNTNLMNLEKARESGAEALFGEKYDAEVRVVSMGESIELCGGTHVKNTAEIEAFKIISEKSIASGIRRIEARSSFGLKKYLDEQAEKLQIFTQDLCEKIKNRNQEIFNFGGAKPDESSLESLDAKTLEEILKQKDKEIERLKKQNLYANLENLTSQKIGEINLASHVFEDVEAKDLREIATEIKNKKQFQSDHIFVFFGVKDEKISVCISLNQNLIEKFDATKLIAPIVEAIGGKGGGGKKDLAMGGGVNKEAISQAIEVLKNLIK